MPAPARPCQALFIDIVFREQQSEYADQGIPWEHVAYDDNAAALTLLDGPQVRHLPPSTTFSRLPRP